MIYLTIVNNPFDPGRDRETKRLNVIPGTTVKNYLTTCLIPDNYQVYLASPSREIGKVLTTEEINGIIPVAGDAIIVMPVIAGGGDDDNTMLMTVAAIAIMVMSNGASGAITSAYGTTGAAAFWASAAALAVQIAGGMLVANYFKKKATEESKIYGWGSITSTAGEGNSIPITFGKVRTGGQLLAAHVTYDGDKSYLNMLYCGGEGPCKYTGNGEDENCTGISDILVNGNPITDFTDVVVYKRAGLNNQTPIPNFNDTIVDQTIATELVYGNDWTTATTAGDAVDGIEAVLELPYGAYHLTRNGNRQKTEIDIKFEYKLHSDTVWVSGHDPRHPEYYEAEQTYLFYFGTNQAQRILLRLDNLQPPGKYDVRLKCTYKEDTDEKDVNKIYWKTLSAISQEDFSHPNLIMLGIKALATDKLNNGMPTITWVQEREKCWVWNPYTSTYIQKDLKTPAWACYDLFARIKQYYNINTSAMETVVEGIPVSRMDYDSFNEAATYQEGLFNGKARCDCNYILDSAETLYDAKKELEIVGRMKIIPRGTKYACIMDMPVTTPVQLFNSANTIIGSFSESFSSTANRANSIEVRFRNKDNDYEWDVATVSVSDYDDLQTVPNPVQITLNACTDWYYAHQIGAYMLRQNQLITRTISHSHGIDSIGVQVGDVYYYQTDVTEWGQGGRIVAADANSITLDQDVFMDASKTYQAIVRMSDDTLVTKTIQSANTFSRVSVAYKEDGTAVASGVARTYSVDGYNLTTVEEGTTNLVPTNIAKMSSLTGLNGYYATPLSIVSENLICGYPVLKVDCTDENNQSWPEVSHGFHIDPNVMPEITAGTTVVCSAYVIVPSGVGFTIGGRTTTSEGQGNKSYTGTGLLQRVSTNPFSLATNERIALQITVPAHTDVVFYAGGLQVEQKGFATSFVDGTRAAETLTISTTGASPSAGTVEGVFEVTDLSKRSSEYNAIFNLSRAAGANGILLLHAPDDTWLLETYEDGGTYNNARFSHTLTPNGLYYYKCHWSLALAKVEFWSLSSKTKVAEISINNPKLPSQFTGLNIGRWTTSGYLNTRFGKHRLSNIARITDPDFDNLMPCDSNALNTFGETRKLYVTSPYVAVPAADDLYSFGESTIAAKPFRVISNTRDGDLQRKITGIEYVDALYEELASVPVPNYTSSTPVTDLIVNSHLDEGGAPWLDISWMPPRNVYNGARIEVDGKKVGEVKAWETMYAHPVPSTGTYSVKVTAIDLFGNDAGSATASYTVTLNDPPAQPTIATIDTAVKGFTVNL